MDTQLNTTNSCIDSHEFANHSLDVEMENENTFATNFNNFNNYANDDRITFQENTLTDYNECDTQFKFDDEGDYFLDGGMNYDNFMRMGKNFEFLH